MAYHHKPLAGQVARCGRWLLLVALAGLPALAGCVTLPWQPEPKEKPPEGKATTVAVTWENQVFFQPDVNNGGKPTPCLGGRIYLLGNQGSEPIACHGKVEIRLMCNDVIDKDGEPKLLEIWPLPDELMQQMCQKDMIGWGYSITLPWATYHPALKNLTVSVCFTPKDGFPIWAQRQKLNFRQTEKFLPIKSSVQIPGFPQPKYAGPGNMGPNGQPPAPNQMLAPYSPSAPQQLPPPALYPPAAPNQPPAPGPYPPPNGPVPYVPPAGAVSANYPAPTSQPPYYPNSPVMPANYPAPASMPPNYPAAATLPPNYPTAVSYNANVQIPSLMH